MPLPVAAMSSAREGAAAVSSNRAVKVPAVEATLPANPPATLLARLREMAEMFNLFDRENDLINFIMERC